MPDDAVDCTYVAQSLVYELNFECLALFRIQLKPSNSHFRRIQNACAGKLFFSLRVSSLFLFSLMPNYYYYYLYTDFRLFFSKIYFSFSLSISPEKFSFFFPILILLLKLLSSLLLYFYQLIFYLAHVHNNTSQISEKGAFIFALFKITYHDKHSKLYSYIYTYMHNKYIQI